MLYCVGEENGVLKFYENTNTRTNNRKKSINLNEK